MRVAGQGLPVSASSITKWYGMRFGSRNNPPPTATSDRAASGSPMFAVRDDDDEIARQCKLEPARERVSLDRGDHRLRRRHRHDAEPASLLRRTHVPLRGRDQVLAGAEHDVGAGDDAAPQRVVFLERVDRRFHRTRGCAVERISALGTVDADDHEVLVDPLADDDLAARLRG